MGDRIEERRLEGEKQREREKEAERQRDRRRREREELERKRRDEDRRREAERRRRMPPSPTFRKRSRSRDRLTSREEREVRRKARHDRKKSDVFKGSLSEGQRKIESSDEELKDVEIPMDSDDEEAQIRKRREARQKMLQRLQTDDNSPASSPATPGSPMLDRFKEKN